MTDRIKNDLERGLKAVERILAERKLEHLRFCDCCSITLPSYYESNLCPDCIETINLDLLQIARQEEEEVCQ